MVEGVPHYLLNSESSTRPITVSEYQRRAKWRLREIASRVKLPLLVGGTGLYVRSVVDNFLIPVIKADSVLRNKLEQQTTARLYTLLKRLDASYASRISSNNRRYIMRALEVIEKTGETFTQQQKFGPPQFEWLQIGIQSPREQLYQRIDQRIGQMVARGLLEETSRLAKRCGWQAQVMNSLGYKQLNDYFSGKASLAEALTRVKYDTRHYARRQLIWLRRDKRIKWVKTEGQARLLITNFLYRN
jgi:tRNA dimethylallyltransferase